MIKRKCLILMFFSSLLVSGCASIQIKEAPRQSPDTANKNFVNGKPYLPFYRCTPLYPKVAADNKQEGWVFLEFDVDINGNTKNIRVIDSSPPKLFDTVASKCLRDYRYKPVLVDGKAVETKGLKLVISFEMAN